MNNEMMPLIVFLLQSEDLKKQSDRIMQEVRNNRDAKIATDDFITSLSNADVVRSIIQNQKDQLKLIRGIQQSIEELKKKVGRTEGEAYSPELSNTHIPADIEYSESDKKRDLKK